MTSLYLLRHWKLVTALLMASILAAATIAMGLTLLALTGIQILALAILVIMTSLTAAFVYNLSYELIRVVDEAKENKWTWKIFTTLALTTLAIVGVAALAWYVAPIIPFITGIALFASFTPTMVAAGCAIAAGAITCVSGLLTIAAYELTCWLDSVFKKRPRPLILPTDEKPAVAIDPLDEWVKNMDNEPSVSSSQKSLSSLGGGKAPIPRVDTDTEIRTASNQSVTEPLVVNKSRASFFSSFLCSSRKDKSSAKTKPASPQCP